MVAQLDPGPQDAQALVMIPQAPSSFIVCTWAWKWLPYPNFGLKVWAMMVLGAFGDMLLLRFVHGYSPSYGTDSSHQSGITHGQPEDIERMQLRRIRTGSSRN